MAVGDKKTVTITVDQVELDALRNGLELARRSADRQVKSGAIEGVANVYKRHLQVVLALQAKLPQQVS